MQPTIKAARIAGAVYLSMSLVAPFSLIYVPHKLIVSGNPTATASNILAHEMLFRFGIVSEVVSSIIFMFVALALYRLLKNVDKAHATLMVALVLVSTALGLVNALNNVAALTLLRGDEFLAVFGKPQLDAMAAFFLRLHGNGNAINELFWGLWLFPFGVLVMKSRFLPRILGALLIVNCFAYLAASLTALLLPGYAHVVSQAVFPALFGEVWIMAWLLIKGAKAPPLAAA